MYNKFFKRVIGTFAEMNCTKEAAINPFRFSVLTNNLNFRLSFLLLLYVCMYVCMHACIIMSTCTYVHICVYVHACVFNFYK